ncbi:ABC-type multidrug transport system fused ATPase/permease subunit [Nakamurella sp. UYEF19]|uniref:hypothetical protein n=1 Tax=Nakamurella sp. UYEF19 TaxID=1756392 RepID=UPI00339710D2
MPSSEPRSTNPQPSFSHSAGALSADNENLLKSNVPFTTHILLVGSMILFFIAATLITLQTSWQWWLIPAAIAIPVVAVLIERGKRVSKARAATRLMEAELRAARQQRTDGTGSSGGSR